MTVEKLLLVENTVEIHGSTTGGGVLQGRAYLFSKGKSKRKGKIVTSATKQLNGSGRWIG